MSLAVRAPIVIAVAALVALPARAADQQAVLDQIAAKNKAGVAAYEAGNLDKMKKEIMKAVSLGEGAGLGDNPAMAKTYALAAVVQIEAVEDNDAAVRFFVKALRASPDAQVPAGMATSPVVKAFKQAKDIATPNESELLAGKSDAPAAEKPGKAGKGEKSEKSEKADRAEKEKAEAEVAERAERDRADKDRADRERADRDRAEKADRAERDKAARTAAAELENERQKSAAAVAAERKRAAEDAKERDRAASEERDRVHKDMMAAKEAENKERVTREGLQKEKAERDKALADTKGRLQMAEEAKADKDKQIAEAKNKIAQLEKAVADRDKQLGDRGKQIADGKTRIGQLEKAVADRDKAIAERDKQIADGRAKVTQLEKERADRDKAIADGKERERKEHEARTVAEKARQVFEAKERDRQSKEEKERQEWNKLAEGPNVPARIPEPLHCSVPDEAESGKDLFVHCIAQAQVGAKSIAFYYRKSGVSHFNSLSMERFGKGWYSTVIPANNVRGKMLQYYAEARDAKDAVVATNGKPSSPNILSLQRGAEDGPVQARATAPASKR